MLILLMKIYRTLITYYSDANSINEDLQNTYNIYYSDAYSVNEDLHSFMNARYVSLRKYNIILF